MWAQDHHYTVGKKKENGSNVRQGRMLAVVADVMLNRHDRVQVHGTVRLKSSHKALRLLVSYSENGCESAILFIWFFFLSFFVQLALRFFGWGVTNDENSSCNWSFVTLACCSLLMFLRWL